MGAVPAFTVGGVPVVAATPSSNPPSGQLWYYAKSDLKLYTLDSSGVETQVGASSGGRTFAFFAS